MDCMLNQGSGRRADEGSVKFVRTAWSRKVVVEDAQM